MNNEKIAINSDGIRVNRAKEIIYFQFATEPLTLILFLIEFFISIKIKIKKTIRSVKFANSRYCKLFSFRSMKLFPINVKKVRKANNIVKIKITIINKFLFNKANII